MGIEDTIIKVVRDENNMLLGKLEDVINHAISGIKKGYGDVFLPDYVPVRKATELLGCSYKELLKRLNAINAKPEKVGTRNCITRDELLKILSEYIEDGEHSVLFSTHITGDLERAADYITYISYGELYFTGSKDDFVDMFRIVKGGIEELSDDLKNKAAGIRTFPTGFEALMKTEDISGFPNLTVDPATIDEIVVFTSKKGDDYE